MDLLSKKQVLSLSTPLSEIKYMGRLSGIYFLINEGSIIYIGISEDISRRVRSHSYDRLKTFNCFSFLENSTYKGLRDLEYLYIRVFQPKHNKQHVDKKLKNMKYTPEEVAVHKKHLSVTDMAVIAEKHGFFPQTLRNILIGKFSYNVEFARRLKMIKEAKDLIQQRVINDLKVIEPKTL